jgi:mono/diheme cytochrome c family protein
MRATRQSPGRARTGRSLLSVAGASVLLAAAFVLAPAAQAQQGNPTAGKSVFASAGCGACHTFTPAGTTGTIGPNLNTSNTTFAESVRVVTNGSSSSAGAMPPFSGQLSATQIRDVSAFVTGTGGSGSQTPAQTTPAQTTPAQTAPAQTTPAPTTPAQTAPAQTTPAETPAETTAPVEDADVISQQQPAPSGQLPSTGFDVVGFAVLGAVLCGLGLLLVLWRPRKQTTRP